MASPARHTFLPRFGMAATLVGLISLTGCQQWLGGRGAQPLPPTVGVQPLKGLAQNVSVRRNPQGMPLIESGSFHDALFAQGYLAANDRLADMLRMRLLAEGRLAEIDGAQALDGDRLMRAINLKKSAAQLYAAASPRLKRFFEVYARGVNAYLFRYRDQLPADIVDGGYRPAYWQAEDSALIFVLFAFSTSANLEEELNTLVLAQKVGADKAAWLLPSYPDEPLPLAESDKLRGIDLATQVPGLAGLASVAQQFKRLGLGAGNNWAMAPSRSRAGKSLLALDLQFPLDVPGPWSTVQIRAPKYQAAGLALAGLPGVLAGFNGKLAWGFSSVMGDNQDLFLERLQTQGNRLMVQVEGQWQPVGTRTETYTVKGQRPIRETLYETRHGTLLNSVFDQAGGAARLTGGYGLALQAPELRDDKTLDALFDLSRAPSVEKAFDASREVRALAANMVFADAQDVGWQVTGRYPNRSEGAGLLPSPGWDKRYDWDGYADAMLHPYDQSPAQGWVGTANQRVAPPGYGMQLSKSWSYPERAERLAELAGTGKHDTRSLIAMQYDQTTLFAGKLKKMFQAPGMAQPLNKAIDALPAADRARAREALTRLLAFDGRLTAQSADAALYALFLQESARLTFLDELGPEQSPAWQAFVDNARLSYSAQADHLLGRDDSPFWDDRTTPATEDKPTVLARSLAAAVSRGETLLGADRKTWQWGKLHRYTWTDTRGKTVRGPTPAGGDHSTLNTAAYAWGSQLEAVTVPAIRMLVDFAQVEPLLIQTATGQSDVPASPNYLDGADAWLKGQYASMPLQLQNYDKGYGTRRLTLTPAK